MIARISTHFSGSITIGGVDAAAAPTRGFVFQDPPLLPWLTAIHNVRAADPRCMRKHAMLALEQVGLTASATLFPLSHLTEDAAPLADRERDPDALAEYGRAFDSHFSRVTV
jgi:ABC-type nitrate/sulfonate/bicarbonate transport system ATPase subunit